ncbi:TBC1 domain family member 10A isoform X1 [Oncorhynchus tshawytscha]|uniref:TBC1 domain family member 10A isoform X1 n=1 Tax=Oncorhynchus tshawytscha TaxID=74940 RepID=UPI000D0A0595|nr:TBC1 domain family member 10A isoform X1 [Oncorhynchus tshawytscha]
MAKIEPGNGLKSAESRKSLRGTTESLALTDGEGNLFGSDSELNVYTSERQTDKYGFIGGAQQYSEQSAENIPPEVLRQREAKWLDMLNNWDKWMAKRHKKMKLRCQKGIPPSLRGRAWLYLSGGKVKREQHKGKFEELDSQAGDPKWVDVIERDLHRQFPFHEMFVARGGHGQQDLYRVLKAYTLHRPEEGYCQAQAPIAAVLLMHMPAEDAFWGLVQICEKYLPGYYSAGLEAIQLDGEILFTLLKRVSPLAHRHLKKHKLDPILYMTEWFMCAFSRTLPWVSVLRVWDMFLCEGVKIIFRVGLVVLKCMLGSQDKLKTCQGQYETMELLKTIDTRYMQEGFLVREILELPVSELDIEKEHLASVRRWKETRGELHCKSLPRMHGAKAIMAAEPPSRQDLRQNPTIIVESPLATKSNGEDKERKNTKEQKNGKKNSSPTQVAAYLEPSEPSPLLKDTALLGSNQSLSSTEYDTYL